MSSARLTVACDVDSRGESQAAMDHAAHILGELHTRLPELRLAVADKLLARRNQEFLQPRQEPDSEASLARRLRPMQLQVAADGVASLDFDAAAAFSHYRVRARLAAGRALLEDVELIELAD